MNQIMPACEILEDKFIMMVDAKRNDLHNEFLQGRYPVIFLENEILYGLKGLVNKDENFSIPIGKANIEQEGQGLIYDSTFIGPGTFKTGIRTSVSASWCGAACDPQAATLVHGRRIFAMCLNPPCLLCMRA